MSIQAYKLQDNYTVFGIAQQEIKDGKEFRGAQILPLGMLERDNFLREKIQQCLDELGKNLLPSYQGFF
ncbi:MAG: hypothetical protein Q8O99_03465 [bacterium]|nr:hypothetical protein [bacterium]